MLNKILWILAGIIWAIVIVGFLAYIIVLRIRNRKKH